MMNQQLELEPPKTRRRIGKNGSVATEKARGVRAKGHYPTMEQDAPPSNQEDTLYPTRQVDEPAFADEEESGEPESIGQFLSLARSQAALHQPVKQQQQQEPDRSLEAQQYNPHPDSHEVAMLRTGYSALLRQLREERRHLIDPASDRLVDLIDQANLLHQHVHRTVDAALDARFMAASADLGTEKLHRLPLGSNAFTSKDLTDLLQRLKTRCPEPLAFFERVGHLAERQWRGVIGVETVAGLVELPSRPRAGRTRRSGAGTVEDGRLAPAVHPAVVSRSAEEGRVAGGTACETTDLVIRVWERLSDLYRQRAGQPALPLGLLVADPSSYARTVELLFYLSFLVADRRISLWWDAQLDDFCVRLPSADSADDGPGGQATGEDRDGREHCILAMSMRQWRAAIEKYGLQEPLIKLST